MRRKIFKTDMHALGVSVRKPNKVSDDPRAKTEQIPVAVGTAEFF